MPIRTEIPDESWQHVQREPSTQPPHWGWMATRGVLLETFWRYDEIKPTP